MQYSLRILIRGRSAFEANYMKGRRSPVLTFVWTLDGDTPFACSHQLLIASGSEPVRILIINRAVLE